MNTTNIMREQISALADNELPDGHLDVTLAALRQQDGREAWGLYHQIGDALRSDDLNTQVHTSLTSRIFASLEDEPILMPAAKQPLPGEKYAVVKRFAAPGMAVAAVAVAVFLTMPQMMTQNAQVVASNSAPMLLASAAPDALAVADGDVLRDPRIDEYLMAHQRFSPSPYSTAQYARSATFDVDTDN